MQGRAQEKLLDTYSAERLPVAHLVLRATHALTQAMTLRSRPLLAVRNRVMSTLIGTPAVQDRLLHLAAGLGVNYRATHQGKSSLRAVLSPFAPPQPGDRLPDVKLPNSGRLYDALRHPGFTLLVFGQQDPAALLDLYARVRGRVQVLVVATHETLAHANDGPGLIFDAEGELHRRFGRADGGAILVRPDRYVAATSPDLTVALRALDGILPALDLAPAEQEVVS